jgi:hypothetical protein
VKVYTVEPQLRHNLANFLKSDLTPAERALAQAEGWILGVPRLDPSGPG